MSYFWALLPALCGRHYSMFSRTPVVCNFFPACSTTRTHFHLIPRRTHGKYQCQYGTTFHGNSHTILFSNPRKPLFASRSFSALAFPLIIPLIRWNHRPRSPTRQNQLAALRRSLLDKLVKLLGLVSQARRIVPRLPFINELARIAEHIYLILVTRWKLSCFGNIALGTLTCQQIDTVKKCSAFSLSTP